MTENELAGKIQTAFEHAVPDVLDSVLRDCAGQKGTIIAMKNKKRTHFARFAGLAAALVLIAAGLLGTSAYRSSRAVASVISLDVNPSIEIFVNSKERVLAVTPLNGDAVTVIDGMDFRNSALDVTVNALIGSMLRHGYLSEISNSILVSVDSEDPAAGAAMQERLAREINDIMSIGSVDGAVLSQTIRHDQTVRQLSEEYGITEGKAQLISEISENDPRHSFSELADLTVHELNLLSSGQNTELSHVSSTGTASDKGYIGEKEALCIAAKHAGLNPEEIPMWLCGMDYEKGSMVYELQFLVNGMEYEYDIHAETGAVVAWEKERADRNDAAEYTQPTKEMVFASATPAPASTGAVTDETAKEIALQHAGVASSDARFTKCRLDREDGTEVYEIEFRANGMEYEYEIRVSDGVVVKAEKERD